MLIRNLLTFVFSSTILFLIVTINFLSTDFLSTIITIVCFITLLQLTIQKSNPPIWVVLYIISIIVFLCLNEILFSINLLNLNNYISVSGVGYYYSVESYNKALIYVFYFVSGVYFALIFISLKKSSISALPTNKIVNVKLFKIFFMVCFLFMVLDKFSIYLNSNVVGYVDAIHTTSSSSSFYILIDILYPVLFSALCIAYSQKKISPLNLAFLTIFFLIPYFLTFMSGFRGEFIGKLIALIILFSSIIKIPRYYYMVGGLIIIIGTLGMEFIRFDDTLSFLSLPLEAYFLAFSYLGNSFEIIPLVIENQDYLSHTWKYFFGGPLALFSFDPTYSAQGILSKPYLAQHLMYIIDSKRFFGGSTIGSSVVAEIFLLSPYLILPISFLIMWLSKIIINKSFCSVMFFYISYSYFENLLFIPRGGFLKFIDKEFIIGLILIIIFVNLPPIKFNLFNKNAN